jgi:hypothetical protein
MFGGKEKKFPAEALRLYRRHLKEGDVFRAIR